LLRDTSVTTPATLPDTRHVYCLYTIRAENRDELQRGLAAANIQTAIHYPTPIHLMPAYSDVRYKLGDLPVAEACALTVLSLPLYPQLNGAHLAEVAAAVARLARRKIQEPLLVRR
jgi:dTDP-4-amino-4,6-dideoxygalactose transaminase